MKTKLKNNLSAKKGCIVLLKQVAFLSMVIPTLASAGSSTLYVKNDTTHRLNILVESGKDQLELGECLPGERKTIPVVSANDTFAVKGSVKDSITGKVTAALSDNKCSDLFVGNAYHVVFKEGSAGVGVTCHSKTRK